MTTFNTLNAHWKSTGDKKTFGHYWFIINDQRLSI